MRFSWAASWLLACVALCLQLLVVQCADGLNGAASSEEECFLGCSEQYVSVVYDDLQGEVNDVVVADMNKDGLKDIVIATNEGVVVVARADLDSDWQTVFSEKIGGA